jgi:hypothetical protein
MKLRESADIFWRSSEITCFCSLKAALLGHGGGLEIRLLLSDFLLFAAYAVW